MRITSLLKGNCTPRCGQDEIYCNIYNARSMNLGLKNRVALIAAASQGIGLATAEAFAAEGCRVAICARNEETLELAANKIRNENRPQVLTEAVAVTDAEHV